MSSDFSNFLAGLGSAEGKARERKHKQDIEELRARLTASEQGRVRETSHLLNKLDEEMAKVEALRQAEHAAGAWEHSYRLLNEERERTVVRAEKAEADNAALLEALENANATMQTLSQVVKEPLWDRHDDRRKNLVSNTLQADHPGADLLARLKLAEAAANELGPLLGALENASEVYEVDGSGDATGSTLGIELVPSRLDRWDAACDAANAWEALVGRQPDAVLR